ncbi:MAG TPA: hypothetical protein PKM88_16320, partial [bacterium]|nr:hypothetical protein [bacterium]
MNSIRGLESAQLDRGRHRMNWLKRAVLAMVVAVALAGCTAPEQQTVQAQDNPLQNFLTAGDAVPDFRINQITMYPTPPTPPATARDGTKNAAAPAV